MLFRELSIESMRYSNDEYQIRLKSNRISSGCRYFFSTLFFMIILPPYLSFSSFFFHFGTLYREEEKNKNARNSLVHIKQSTIFKKKIIERAYLIQMAAICVTSIVIWYSLGSIESSIRLYGTTM